MKRMTTQENLKGTNKESSDGVGGLDSIGESGSPGLPGGPLLNPVDTSQFTKVLKVTKKDRIIGDLMERHVTTLLEQLALEPER